MATPEEQQFNSFLDPGNIFNNLIGGLFGQSPETLAGEQGLQTDEQLQQAFDRINAAGGEGIDEQEQQRLRTLLQGSRNDPFNFTRQIEVSRLIGDVIGQGEDANTRGLRIGAGEENLANVGALFGPGTEFQSAIDTLEGAKFGEEDILAAIAGSQRAISRSAEGTINRTAEGFAARGTGRSGIAADLSTSAQNQATANIAQAAIDVRDQLNRTNVQIGTAIGGLSEGKRSALGEAENLLTGLKLGEFQDFSPTQVRNVGNQSAAGIAELLSSNRNAVFGGAGDLTESINENLLVGSTLFGGPEQPTRASTNIGQV